MSIPKETRFIVQDRCRGYERFTAVPGGETLVRRDWMGESGWKHAQLDWFEQFYGSVVVHGCLDGPYYESEDVIGTVGEITEQLRKSMNTKSYAIVSSNGEPQSNLDREGVLNFLQEVDPKLYQVWEYSLASPICGYAIEADRWLEDNTEMRRVLKS